MRHLIFIAIALLLTCCTWKPRGRLAEAERLSDSVPEQALDTLAAIDRATLGEADRYFYDLLCVKATDRSFLDHTDDTLIVGVLNYAYTHQSHGYYPEALYYAGRVYSDLGDYPSALRYYQDALALLPAEKQKLRGNILSQTGRLLTTLRLYDEAVPYIEEVLSIDRNEQDTLNLVYDLQLLGHTFMNDKQFDKAENCFKEEMNYSKNLEPELMAGSKMYLASIKYYKGDIDSALYYIRGIKETIDTESYNNLLAFGGNIYYKAGILDTAYHYASELIAQKELINKTSGYNIILKPALRQFLSTDSLEIYLKKYLETLEKEYTGHGEIYAIYQQSIHNYELHERMRQTAELKNTRLQLFITLIACGLFLTIIVILYQQNRSKKTMIELQSLKERLQQLKLSLNITNDNVNNIKPTDNIQSMREQLRDELFSLIQNSSSKEIEPQIARSDIIVKLQDLINNKKIISEESPLWQEIESVVISVSPNFKSRLELLTRKNLSDTDYHLALLIRCFLSPTNIAVLFVRERGTINSRRTKLGFQVFEKKVGFKDIDSLIRLL